MHPGSEGPNEFNMLSRVGTMPIAHGQSSSIVSECPPRLPHPLAFRLRYLGKSKLDQE